MRIRFIVNPKAGCRKDPEKLLSVIHTTFSDTDHRYDVQFTKFRGHATTLAQAALDQGYDVVAAVGGDGTANDVGRAVVSSGTALGIVPAGSGNGLARELGIPLNAAGACQVILNGRVRAMDVGVVNGRYFFMGAGVGFDAVVSHRFNERSNARRGMLPYYCIAVREALDFRPERTILRILGQELVLEPFMVTVANARQLGGSAIIAPRARIDDGLFDVCVVANLTIPQFLCQAPRLLNGSAEKVPQLEIWRADHLEIERRNHSPMQVDGESVEAPPRIRINVVPRALKVLVPPAVGESSCSTLN